MRPSMQARLFLLWMSGTIYDVRISGSTHFRRQCLGSVISIQQIQETGQINLAMSL